MINKVLLAILPLWPSLFFATETPDFDVDSLISDVRYEYEIFPDLSPERMCIGDLYVRIEIPEKTDNVILYFTRGPQNPPQLFNSKHLEVFGKTSIEASVERLKAHNHFRVLFYIDGTAYSTSVFAVDDYIIPADLEYLNKLQGQDAVGAVTDEGPVIEIKNRAVSIICDSILYLTINTVDGKTMINERIDRHADIHLDSGIYIITYVDKQKKYIKKIMIK